MEAPSFMKKIGDTEIYKGMTGKFTACATGYPEPEVISYIFVNFCEGNRNFKVYNFRLSGLEMEINYSLLIVYVWIVKDLVY